MIWEQFFFNSLLVFYSLTRLTAFLEPSRAIEYLAYLGFTYQTGFCYLLDAESNGGSNGVGDVSSMGLPTESGRSQQQQQHSNRGPLPDLTGCLTNEANCLLRALTVTGERRLDYIRRQTNRTVFYARVYGARKVGKVRSQDPFFALTLKSTPLEIRPDISSWASNDSCSNLLLFTNNFQAICLEFIFWNSIGAVILLPYCILQ